MLMLTQDQLMLAEKKVRECGGTLQAVEALEKAATEARLRGRGYTALSCQRAAALLKEQLRKLN